MGRPPKHAAAILALLAERPAQWRHGYDMLKATGLASGTLYPLLLRLAEAKLIEARWQDSPIAGRPPRHAYRITAAGLREVAAANATIREPAGGPVPAGSR